MALGLQDKKKIVQEVAVVAKGAMSLVAVEYLGSTAEQLTALRKAMREANVDFRVVRNTLASRAFEGTQFDCIKDELVGPLALAFSKEHPGAAARLLKDFCKKNEKLVVKALALDGQLLPKNGLDLLASLPTQEEAIAQLLSVMQAPITQFVRTTAEPVGKLVRTLAAVRDAKQAAA
ncbi:MAG TPA: 50S ribosomal protein L10 [Gammaproteobacteria bacterium]|nr:50S ribosomal protein L10 [Gammaproteobacteria bacterium]